MRPETIWHMVLYLPLSRGHGALQCSPPLFLLSFDDYLFNDLASAVCRWHAEILGREDNTTEQVLTLITVFSSNTHLIKWIFFFFVLT